jgi:hypothetical protein
VVIILVASKTCYCRRCRPSDWLEVVEGVDIAKRVLSKPHRDTSKASAKKLSSLPKILPELVGSQFAVEVLKGRGFSNVAFVDFGPFLPLSILKKNLQIFVSLLDVAIYLLF